LFSSPAKVSVTSVLFLLVGDGARNNCGLRRQAIDAGFDELHAILIKIVDAAEQDGDAYEIGNDDAARDAVEAVTAEEPPRKAQKTQPDSASEPPGGCFTPCR